MVKIPYNLLFFRIQILKVHEVGISAGFFCGEVSEREAASGKVVEAEV